MIFQRDVQITDDGDLVLDNNGDIKLATAHRTGVQDLIMRINTAVGELRAHPDFGSSITNYVGSPLSIRLVNLLRANLFREITRGNRFRPSTVRAEVVPINPDEVLLLVSVNDSIAGADPGDKIVLSYTLSFDTGQLTLMS